MAGAHKARAHKVAAADVRRDRFRPLEFEIGVVVILLPSTSINDVLFSYTPHCARFAGTLKDEALFSN